MMDHCPTCGQAWAMPDVECAAIMPGTEHDVIPVRCRALVGEHPHPLHTHWHPSLWPGTPDLLWDLDYQAAR
jgi:hypothetical protein